MENAYHIKKKHLPQAMYKLIGQAICHGLGGRDIIKADVI